MEDEQEFTERPLDFSQRDLGSICPYCGEHLDADELNNCILAESNTLVCPNCRKKLNIHELGGSL